MKKALIFYVSKKSGHFHAACAIEKALHEMSSEISTQVIDGLKYTNPILEKVLSKAYHELIKKKPELWGKIYDNPEVARKTKKTRENITKKNIPKIEKLIKEENPDIIYCTQAFPCWAISEYKKKTKSKIKLVGVLTDYAPHHYWVNEYVDLYVTPSEEIKNELAEKGVPVEKIKPLGIPIDPDFSKSYDPKLIRKELGFNDIDPIVLVMGGNQGLGAIEKVVKGIRSSNKHKYQMLVVVGTNAKLFKKLSDFIKKEKLSYVKVLPYVKNMNQIMEVADLLVTKAGGMTTAEALAKNVPMILIDPIPGHEKKNADFLTKKGAAIEVNSYTEVHHTINVLFDEKTRMDKIKQAISKMSRPNSGIDIASLINEEIL